MAKLYKGAIQDTSTDILGHWLIRTWALEVFGLLDWELNPSPNLDLRCESMRYGDWFGSMRARRGAYQLRWSFFTPDSELFAMLEANQWRTNQVDIVFAENADVFGQSLIAWLDEHYTGHAVTRLELTPEQERQIENASEAEIRTIAREADLTYWKDVHRQAQASGNVRDFLDRLDISRSTYYHKVKLYKL